MKFCLLKLLKFDWTTLSVWILYHKIAKFTFSHSLFKFSKNGLRVKKGRRQIKQKINIQLEKKSQSWFFISIFFFNALLFIIREMIKKQIILTKSIIWKQTGQINYLVLWFEKSKIFRTFFACFDCTAIEMPQGMNMVIYIYDPLVRIISSCESFDE